VKSDALEEAASLASTVGCPVYQQTIAYGAHFLSEHPCFIGALPRDQRQTSKILGVHDLLIVLGSDPVRMSVYSEHEPLPTEIAVVQIGLVDHDIAKNFPVEVALKADVKETLRELVPALSIADGSSLAKLAAKRIADLQLKNWSASRERLVREITQKNRAIPIDPDWAALQVVDALPPEAILVDEGLTSSRYMSALRNHRDRYGYHQMASGGIGWGLPASVGASLANPGRPVVCYSGDGSAMYSIQSLWTAAHHRLPITFVLLNNGGYRIIKQRLQAFHGTNHFVGMDFRDPSVDFVGIAHSLGLNATRVGDPAEFGAALSSAIDRRSPSLIEVLIDRSV
jgi:benzoylformate decarboxylase